MDQCLRKVRHELILNGRWVIIFGLWNFLKLFLYPLFAMDYFRAICHLDEQSVISTEVFWGTLFGFLFLYLLMRFAVGRQAILDGKREKRQGRLYLIAAGVMVIQNGGSIFISLSYLFSHNFPFGDVISNFLLQTASIINLVFLILASLRLDRLRNQCNEEENSHAA